MVFSAWRSKVAEKLLGTIDIQIPERIRPGETFDVLLHCEPNKAITLNNVTMTLSGKEVVVRGSGTDRTTYTHDVYEQEQEFDAGRVLVPGEHALFSTQFTLPANAGPSFAASDNELRWTIDIRFDIPNWPDWIGTYVLAVRP